MFHKNTRALAVLFMLSLFATGAFAQGGAADLYPAGNGWRIVWSQSQRGQRPWSAPSGSGE